MALNEVDLDPNPDLATDDSCMFRSVPAGTTEHALHCAALRLLQKLMH